MPLFRPAQHLPDLDVPDGPKNRMGAGRELPGCMSMPPRQVAGPCAFGCDVRPGSWDLQVAEVVRPRAKRGPRGEGVGEVANGLPIPRIVFSGKLGGVDALEQVAWVARQYSCRVGIVDSRPEASDAIRLQRALGSLGVDVWRAQYATNPGDKEMMGIDHKEKLVTLERTLTIDNVLHAINNGLVALPTNFRQLCNGAFTRELTGPARVMESWRGRDYYRWEKNGDDHQLHALNYLLVAIEFGRLDGVGGGEILPTRAPRLRVAEATMDDEDDGFGERLQFRC